MPVAFDTLKAAQRLREEAGFSEQQASVLVTTLAEGVGENLATKADIEAGFAAMQAAIEAVRAEMRASEERTQAEFRVVRAEAREREQGLKLYLGRLAVGGVGVILASVGIVAAIILTAG